MKKLYKRLAATFLLSAILSVFIFAVSLYKRGKEENGRYLDQLLTSVTPGSVLFAFRDKIKGGSKRDSKRGISKRLRFGKRFHLGG